jgi:hypothetical protein
VVPADAALMIVGLLRVRRKEAPRGRCRQDDDRGGRQEVLLDEHADVIREAVKAIVGEMMELEVFVRTSSSAIAWLFWPRATKPRIWSLRGVNSVSGKRALRSFAISPHTRETARYARGRPCGNRRAVPGTQR